MRARRLVSGLLCVLVFSPSLVLTASADDRKVLVFGDRWGEHFHAHLSAVLNANPLTGESYVVVDEATGGSTALKLGSAPGEGLLYGQWGSGQEFLREKLEEHPDVDVIHLSIGGNDWFWEHVLGPAGDKLTAEEVAARVERILDTIEDLRDEGVVAQHVQVYLTSDNYALMADWVFELYYADQRDLAFVGREDPDGDLIASEDDNCQLHANPVQSDRDADGYGDACDFDLNGDGVADIGLIGANWGLDVPAYDLDDSGMVGGGDMAQIGAHWLEEVGPSGPVP